MTKPNYTPGQPVDVEFYNSSTKSAVWIRGTVIAVVQATDIEYRVEVEMSFTQLTGHQAAHPDCVRPVLTKKLALQKLESLADSKKVYRNSMAYQTAKAAIENPGMAVVCGGNVGTGRYSGNKSWQRQTATVLRLAGIPFECLNVAPNGGKNGDRIKVTL